MSEYIVIKLGGTILENTPALDRICKDIALLSQQRQNIVLVHGGGIYINKVLQDYHIPSEFINGLRITSTETMDHIETILCGYVNKYIVKRMLAYQGNAVGLSGIDTGLMIAAPLDSAHLGRVGQVIEVNTDIIHRLSRKYIIVMAAIGLGHDNQSYNINADIAACELAIALQAQRLIYVTDQDGVFIHQQLIPTLRFDEAQRFIAEKLITDGMIVKVNTIFGALRRGVGCIKLINGNKNNVMELALSNENIHCTSFEY